MTTPFVTVEEVKSYLPIRSGNYDYDDKLRSLILTASQQIETATQRDFARKTHTQLFSTVMTRRQFYDFYATTNESGLVSRPRTQMYNLRGYPVSGTVPATVAYDPDRAFAADTILPTDEWLVNFSVNALIVRAETDQHVEALRVVYEAGYEISGGTLSESLPADLKLACIVQTMHLFNRLQPDNIGVDVSRGEGQNATARWTTKMGLSPEVMGMVRHYKALAIGKG